MRDAGRTSSPYFAHGRLDVVLGGLRYRLGQVAERRPDLLTVLAEHLEVAATLPGVLAEVEARAGNLLDRRLELHLPPWYRTTIPRRGAPHEEIREGDRAMTYRRAQRAGRAPLTPAQQAGGQAGVLAAADGRRPPRAGQVRHRAGLRPRAS